jgi:hypothetical protein
MAPKSGGVLYPSEARRLTRIMESCADKLPICAWRPRTVPSEFDFRVGCVD